MPRLLQRHHKLAVRLPVIYLLLSCVWPPPASFVSTGTSTLHHSLLLFNVHVCLFQILHRLLWTCEGLERLQEERQAAQDLIGFNFRTTSAERLRDKLFMMPGGNIKNNSLHRITFISSSGFASAICLHQPHLLIFTANGLFFASRPPGTLSFIMPLAFTRPINNSVLLYSN